VLFCETNAARIANSQSPTANSHPALYSHVTRTRIAGMGHYLPERILTNADLEKLVQTSDQWIRDRTGIRERHIAAPDETASSLGANAARMALEDARIDAADIDLIIAGTSTPDGMFPSVASLVQDKIGARKAGAYDVNAACMGFLSALSAATSYIAAGAYERVLVLGAEVPSRILNWQDRSTCVLFGDGAGAVLLEAAEFGGPLGFAMHSDGSKKHALFADGPCGARDADGNGPAAHLCLINMDGPAMFKLAVNSMADVVRESLGKAQLTVDDIDLMVPHQANLRIIQGTAKALGIPMEKAYLTVHKYGNTFAATIPIALSEASREGRLHEGDRLAMCSIGGGVAWGGMIYEYSRTGAVPLPRREEQLAISG
jgi:3-oxoacyl-[acyl-carrier-protein] synthase-3